MHLMSTTSSNSNTSGSSLSGSTGGGKSTPPARHSSRHRTRNTPHGPLTLHKIARIKMLDRHSCYVAGIQREIATKEILSKPAFFGQFGEISSIRVLRDRDPGEVYLRFHSEKDAIRAIAWCNSQSPLGISAQHGYQKYCIKFIDNKRCKRPNCPHRHSWCDNRDIIASASAITQQGNQIPMTSTNVESSRNGEVHMNAMGQMVDSNGFAMMQNQLMDLKRQYIAQREMMKSILFNVEQLKAENSRLRMENQFLSLVPGANQQVATNGANQSGIPAGYHQLIVDGLVQPKAMDLDKMDLNFDVDLDEGLVHEIVRDVFEEPTARP